MRMGPFMRVWASVCGKLAILVGYHFRETRFMILWYIQIKLPEFVAVFAGSDVTCNHEHNAYRSHSAMINTQHPFQQDFVSKTTLNSHPFMSTRHAPLHMESKPAAQSKLQKNQASRLRKKKHAYNFIDRHTQIGLAIWCSAHEIRVCVCVFEAHPFL